MTMSTEQELLSPRLDPERARNLVLALERRGLDTNRIHVDALPPVSTASTSKVDRRAVTRPGQRVAVGMVAGAVAGVVIGLVAAAVFDTRTGATILAVAIGAALVGGLAGLYSRLAMSTELSDVDSGRTATVRVDVLGLPESEVADIGKAIASF